MDITILPYVDNSIKEQQKQAIVDAQRQEAMNEFKALLSEATTALNSAALDLQQTYAPASDVSEAAVPSTSTVSSDTLSCSAELDSYFAEAAAAYGVDVNLLKSIAKAESGFDPSATSGAGAMGVMQLMPSTASSLGVTNAYNAQQNIKGGAELISQLLKQYNGDTSLALAAYNAGSGSVAKYGGIPPYTETQNYVKKVLDYYGSASDTSGTSNTANASGSVGASGSVSTSDSAGNTNKSPVSGSSAPSAATDNSASGLAPVTDLLSSVEDPDSVQEIRSELNQVLAATFSRMNVTQSSLERMVELLKHSS